MDLKHNHSVKLNDGNLMPVLGFGTFAPDESWLEILEGNGYKRKWLTVGTLDCSFGMSVLEEDVSVKEFQLFEQIQKSKANEATKIAIDVGFRHIDAAYFYQNEEEVGQALRDKMADGTVKREDLFYTTKIWSTFLRQDLVRQCLERSLKKLGLDYVDLCLIHAPIAVKPGDELLPKDASGKIILDVVDIRDTWEALEKCKDLGLTKSIGVSNFNHKQLELILNKPGLKYKPTCNQVECHPYLNQSKLLEFCKSKDIVIVAHSALGSHKDPNWISNDSPYLLGEPILKTIARKHNRTPGQVALRYQLQRGVVVLAKSFNEKRIKENFEVFDFELTPEDMKAIDGLNRNFRYIKFSFFLLLVSNEICPGTVLFQATSKVSFDLHKQVLSHRQSY